MAEKYFVELTGEERSGLERLIRGGTSDARALRNARVLLKADGEDGWADERIAEALDVSARTVARVRRACVEEGLAYALRPPRKPRPPRKLDGEVQAHLVALCCGSPPAGHARWTLRLLAEKAVELELVESVSHEGVRQVLKKTSSSRGGRSAG